MNSLWSSLPTVLTSLQSATLLVKINFGAAAPTLDYLQNLVKASPGLKIPDALKVMYKDNLVVVINGAQASLLDFFERFNKSGARDTTTFQVLDFSSEQAVFALPTRVIHIDENASVANQNEADRQISELLNGNSGFSVHNIGEEQFVFFLPRQIVEDQARGSFFKEEGIKTGWTRRAPEVWSEWLLGRAEEFEKPQVIFSDQWAILSGSAFRKLYELNRMIAGSLPGLGNVDANLTVALSECFEISCEISPRKVREAAIQVAEEPEAEQSGTMNWAARSRIIRYLKANRHRVRLSGKDGMKKGFNELAVIVEFVKNKKAAAQYKKDIAEVGFAATDYSVFASKSLVIEPVHDRVKLGWRIFLRAVGSEFAEKPVVAWNIGKATDEIEFKTGG